MWVVCEGDVCGWYVRVCVGGYVRVMCGWLCEGDVWVVM